MLIAPPTIRDRNHYSLGQLRELHAVLWAEAWNINEEQEVNFILDTIMKSG
jgi:hypothetical protein